uniref:Sulfotransferase domain-containing protein n=1 Tax=Timema douglasi TaxID=61478 RepID=A0A7R8V8Y4_TIMDO|nr:unnamed protein product [Timema douglasi]
MFITMSRQIKVLDNPIINKIKEGCPNYTDTIGSLVVNPPGCVLSNFYLKYEDKIRDFQRLTPLHRCRPQLSQLRTLHSQSQIMRPDSTSCHDRLSQRRPNVHAQNHPGQRTSEEKKRLFTPVPRLVSSSLEDEEDGRFHRLWKNSQFYDIKNLELEARTWYDVWKNKDYGEIVKLSTPHRKCILSLSQEGSSELYDNSANNMHCGKGLILDRNVRKFSQEGLGYVTSLIVSRPGTTWTQEMVWCINNGLNFNEAKTTSLQKRVPYLELNAVSKQSPDVFEYIDQIKSPRLIKTHLPIELLPKEVWTKKPKDLLSVVQKTCRFLGKSYTDTEVEGLLDHLSFSKMKENPSVNYEHVITRKRLTEDIKDLKFFRKGEAGGWKKAMSPELSARFDAWTAEKLKDSDYEVDTITMSYYPFGLYALSTNYANGLGIGKYELEEVKPAFAWTEIRTSISPSSVVELNTTSAEDCIKLFEQQHTWTHSAASYRIICVSRCSTEETIIKQLPVKHRTNATWFVPFVSMVTNFTKTAPV